MKQKSPNLLFCRQRSPPPHCLKMDLRVGKLKMFRVTKRDTRARSSRSAVHLISHSDGFFSELLPIVDHLSDLTIVSVFFLSVEGEEAQSNAKQCQVEESEGDEGAKMTDVVMCKPNHPDSNHNRIIRNSDKRNIERNKESEEEEEEEGQVLNDSGSSAYEVPNGSQLVRRHIQGPQNLETVLRVNGVVKKEKASVINDKRETNLGLQQLLLLEKPKTNGDCSPCLKESKTPVIIVKTVNDLNNGDFRGKEERREASEEERIQEYLRRSDTAVIYQEPVEQANGEYARIAAGERQ